MFLWKNFVVVAGCLGTAWCIVTLLSKSLAERRILNQLAVTALAVSFFAFTALPLPAKLALISIALAICAAAKPPIALSYLVVTALLPFLTYQIAGILGVTTFVTLTVPLVAGIVVVAVRIGLPGKFRRPGLSFLDFLVLLFIVLLVLLSSRGAGPHLVARDLVENVLALGGAYLAGSRSRIDSARTIMLGFVYVGLALALIAIFESVRHWPLYGEIYALHGARGGPSTMRQGFLRAEGPFQDPLAYSIFIASAALMSFGLVSARHRQTIALGAASCVILGLLFTFSRTGLVALVVGCSFLAILQRGKSLLMIIPAGGFAVWYALTISKGDAEGTVSYRKQLFTTLWEFLLENPWIGNNRAIEEGYFKELIQGQGIVDLVNSYLQLGLRGGFVLIFCFLAILITALSRYLLSRNKMDKSQAILKDVIACQLAGMACALAFTSLTDKNLHYVLFTSGLLCAALSQAAAKRSSHHHAEHDARVPTDAGAICRGGGLLGLD